MPLSRLPEPPAQPELRTFQELLLPIIIVYEFVKNFQNRSSLESLKTFIEDFNRDEKRKTGKWPRNKGGSSSVDEVRELAKEGLIDLYNRFSRPEPFKANQAAFREQIGNQFKGKGNPIGKLNRFAFCQRFLSEIFSDYYQFNYQLIAESKKSYGSILDFIEAGETLNDCLINSPNQWQPLKTIVNDTDKIVITDHCRAIYQNDLREPIEAPVTLNWTTDRKKLVRVTLTQLEGFFAIKDRKRPIQFVSETIYQAPQGPIFVTLRAENQRIPAYLQITIEAEPTGEQRMGTFTTIGRRKQGNNPAESVSISGLFTLVSVTEGTQPVETATKQLIQYELQNKLLINSGATRYRLGASQAKWLNFVGKYECTYMRLSITHLQTSFIELFADGRAVLHQKDNTEPAAGWGRITTGLDGLQKLWLFFGNDEELGQARIRFLLEAPEGNSVLKGVFSSETLFTQRIVSGRMLMRRQVSSAQKWPGEFKDIDYSQVSYNDILGKDDLAFFTGQATKFFLDDPSKSLTDGPYWAEIGQRLNYPSAYTTLENFFGKSESKTLQKTTTDPDPSFPDGDFHYYTFKQEEQSKQFLIERNFVTFRKSGVVTIKAGDTEYNGYAYYANKTLKISFLDGERGFLDAYFDLSRDDVTDTRRIRILYGASLWRAGKRIQAKAVVLSRLAKGELNQATETIKFLEVTDPDFEAETTKLIKEEKNSGGVISYLRGERNRFHLSTINAPATGLRPRDNRSRELHFLIAKYYGMSLKRLLEDQPTLPSDTLESQITRLIRKIRENLFQAYVYGFACSFAGLKLDASQAILVPVEKIDDPDLYIAREYKAHFPEANLDDTRITDVLKRIREGAQEQLDLQVEFAKGGFFHLTELVSLGHRLWPDLIASLDNTGLA